MSQTQKPVAIFHGVGPFQGLSHGRQSAYSRCSNVYTKSTYVFSYLRAGDAGAYPVALVWARGLRLSCWRRGTFKTQPPPSVTKRLQRTSRTPVLEKSIYPSTCHNTLQSCLQPVRPTALHNKRPRSRDWVAVEKIKQIEEEMGICKSFICFLCDPNLAQQQRPRRTRQPLCERNSPSTRLQVYIAKIFTQISHLGQLKAKLAKLRRELVAPSTSGGGGAGGRHSCNGAQRPTELTATSRL